MSEFFSREELPFWDSVNEEVQELVGIDADYFVVRKADTTRDDVYDEPTAAPGSPWEFEDPVTIKCIIQEWAETKEATERGMADTFQARAWVSRVMLDDAGIFPQEGDVIVIWQSSSDPLAREIGGAWDIIQITEDGFLGDNPVPLQWVLDLRRRIKYIPERKKPKAVNVDEEQEEGFPA